MKKIIVKWMWSTQYGDFEDGEKTIDVPEGAVAKDTVLEFFRCPDFAYSDAGVHADGVCFNVYRAPDSAFLDGGTYAYHEIEWAGREIPLDL